MEAPPPSASTRPRSSRSAPRFTGATLAAGNAAFALMWGIGGIAGPSAPGGVMTLIGPEALPLVRGLLCVALVGVAVVNR